MLMKTASQLQFTRVKIAPGKRASVQGFVSSLADLSGVVSPKPVWGQLLGVDVDKHVSARVPG